MLELNGGTSAAQKRRDDGRDEEPDRALAAQSSATVHSEYVVDR